jgi:hypothetical protein
MDCYIIDRIFTAVNDLISMIMFTYLELDLPSPPEKFIDFAHKLANSKNKKSFNGSTREKSYVSRTVVYNGVEYTSRFQTRYQMNDDWVAWCKTNLTNQCYEPCLAISEPVSPFHGPHTDIGRNYTLYCSIDNGSPDAVTRFWYLPGEPVVLDATAVAVKDYSQLVEIERVKFKPFRWYLMNPMIIHSVDFVEGRRLSLQANLAHNPFFKNGIKV